MILVAFLLFLSFLLCLLLAANTFSDADSRLVFLRRVCTAFPALKPYLKKFMEGKKTREESKQMQKQADEAQRNAAEIQKLQRSVKNLTQENVALKAKTERLERELQALRLELQQKFMNAVQPAEKHEAATSERIGADGMIDMSDTLPPPSLCGKKMYAFSATSYSPYGFCKNDLSDTLAEQLFVITFTDDTHAELTIVDSQHKKNALLRDLNFYSQLVEVVNRPPSGAIGFYVKEKGRLAFRAGVWEIEKTIKIEIV